MSAVFIGGQFVKNLFHRETASSANFLKKQNKKNQFRKKHRLSLGAKITIYKAKFTVKYMHIRIRQLKTQKVPQHLLIISRNIFK